MGRGGGCEKRNSEERRRSDRVEGVGRKAERSIVVLLVVCVNTLAERERIFVLFECLS